MSDKVTIKLTKSQAHAVIDALMDYIYEHPDSELESEKVKALVNAYTEILNQTESDNLEDAFIRIVEE